MKYPGKRIPTNEEERKALRRYQAIKHLVAGGRTEEEAAAHYDRPRGVCQRCGVKCGPNGRQCPPCRRIYNTEFHQKYAKEKKHWKHGQCRVCLAPFFGNPGRKNCDEHLGKRPEKYKTVKPRTPTPKQMIVLPGSTPNRKPEPMEVKPLEVVRPIVEPRPEPVKVPPGFKVTVCPSVMPSRWD